MLFIDYFSKSYSIDIHSDLDVQKRDFKMNIS